MRTSAYTETIHPAFGGRLYSRIPDAFTDVLVADGNPRANLDFLIAPESNLPLIVKTEKMTKIGFKAGAWL